MSAITEKMGLNYDLDGTEADYFTKLNENTLKIDAFLPLCAISQIDLADLPLSPTDGEIYVVDSSLIYIRQQGTWYNFPLPCGISFYDQTEQNFYKYDGTNIFLDTGTNGVLDAANVGGQIEIYKDKVNGVINFKTIEAGAGISIDDSDPNKLVIESTVGGFPSGTKLIFPQAVAPIGWTLDTSVNDRFVRISNTVGGGTGGSFGNFNHTHTHSHTHSLDGGGWARVAAVGGGSGDILMDVVSTGSSWTSDRRCDSSDQAAGATISEGARLDGDTGSASSNTTSTASISHGSAQHAYINAIIATKD